MSYCCCAVMQSAEIYVVWVKCHTVVVLSCKALRSVSWGFKCHTIVVLSCKALRSMSCWGNVILLLCCHARRWDLYRVGEMSYCCCAVMQGVEIYVVLGKCHTVVVLSRKVLRSMSYGWKVILMLCCHAKHWDLCHVGEMPYCCCAVMQGAEIYVMWVKCHTVVVLSCKALRSMSCLWNVILLIGCHARHWDLCHVGEMPYCCCAVMQNGEIYFVLVKCHTVVVLSCKLLRSMSCGWNVILLLCCHARRWDLCHVGEMSYCCCAVMQGAEIYVMWVKCHTVVVLSCKALRSMSCGWNVILLLCCHSGLLSWCYVVFNTLHTFCTVMYCLLCSTPNQNI